MKNLSRLCLVMKSNRVSRISLGLNGILAAVAGPMGLANRINNVDTVIWANSRHQSISARSLNDSLPLDLDEPNFAPFQKRKTA